jgi:hypothetical protein
MLRIVQQELKFGSPPAYFASATVTNKKFCVIAAVGRPAWRGRRAITDWLPNSDAEAKTTAHRRDADSAKADILEKITRAGTDI